MRKKQVQLSAQKNILLLLLCFFFLLLFSTSSSYACSVSLGESDFESIINIIGGAIGSIIGTVLLLAFIFWFADAAKPIEKSNKSTSKKETYSEGNQKKNSNGSSNNVVYCPKCGARMIRRNGKYGPFYGCSNYPRCRGTRSLK